MPKFTFARSKRHNLVEVAITYECVNNRVAISHEMALLQDLSRLMTSAASIHDHGNTPVEPVITMINDHKFFGTIDLKFPIKTKVEGSDGLPVAYSFAGLHAVLVEIRNICERHREHFIEFGVNLNLEAMTAPWVLPVAGHGVVLRNGFAQHQFYEYRTPHSTKIGNRTVQLDSMMVVGEPGAVAGFSRRWTRASDEMHRFYVYHGNPDHSGLVINVDELRKKWPTLEWQNLAVMVRERDTNNWHYLGSTHNERTLDYVFQCGNYMLNQPLGYDNDATESTGNVFLNDHEYYEFAIPLA